MMRTARRSSRNGVRGSITIAFRWTISMRCWSGADAQASSLSMISRASERKENESHFCTPGLPAGCSSSFQIIKPGSLAPGRPGVAAKVAHGGDVHVLDVPAIGWTLDRVERGLPNQIAFLQLDANIASSALARSFADDARAVVLEVTGENGETLLELAVVHCVARRPVFRPPLRGH